VTIKFGWRRLNLFFKRECRANLNGIELPVATLAALHNILNPQQSKPAMTSETVDQSNPDVVQQSEPYVGQWNRLISTTNWEKGQIICKWREALRKSAAPTSSWSDEKWSQLVGGVSSQHVGRLRRTFERFGATFPDYKRLYWSHFYAALDWDDAEMWLEGAVQSQWSVAQMRKQRWETLGSIPEDKPDDKDVVVVEEDEEIQSLALSDQIRKNDREYIEGPRYEGPDFGDDEETPSARRKKGDAGENPARSKPASDGLRPFESFTDLPEDVSQAANQFKIAIISHRANNWTEISPEDMLGLLDALKQLVGAVDSPPADEKSAAMA
jgi:hypothetical protein